MDMRGEEEEIGFSETRCGVVRGFQEEGERWQLGKAIVCSNSLQFGVVSWFVFWVGSGSPNVLGQIGRAHV